MTIVISIKSSSDLNCVLLVAVKATHTEHRVLQYQINRCNCVKVQVAQNITVVVQHTRSEGSSDPCLTFLTLSSTGQAPRQGQVRINFTPTRRGTRLLCTLAWGHFMINQSSKEIRGYVWAWYNCQQTWVIQSCEWVHVS